MANKQSEQRHEIGMVGLGVMGRNLVLNMADHGFPVAGYDKDPAKVTALRQEAKQRDARGAGDLTWRKLMPSLFDLHREGRMPNKFAIIAVDRVSLRDAALHKHFLDGVKRFSRNGKVKSTGWNDFARHVTYHQGDFKDPVTYSNLEKRCGQLDQEWKVKAGHIFHMATPPVMIGVIPRMLADAGLNRNRVRDRIVVEKPIGHDLDSARELNRVVRESFHESQIFRIDHYLGKETVQNILAFRFANPLFEPIWNRRYVDYVTITVAEEVGVGHRGGLLRPTRAPCGIWCRIT